MNASSSVLNIAGALVHHADEGAPADHRRQTVFIVKRLAFSFTALASVPAVLVCRGAPAPLEILAFAGGLAPLAAATVAARTGRLVFAHAVAILGLACLSLTLWLGLGFGPVCALIWLLAAHAEAKSAADTTLSRLTGALTLAALIAILIVPETHLAPAQGALSCVIVSAAALVYAWVVQADWWQTNEAVPVGDQDMPVWQAISETVDDAVLILDAAGSVVRTRLGSEDRLGLRSCDLMARGFYDRIAVGDRPAFLKTLATAEQKDSTAIAIIGLRTGDSNSRRIEMRIRKLQAAGTTDAAARIVALLRPVADESHAVSAETIMPQTPHLTKGIGHELRTPLNAIIGFSEILASRTLRPADAAKQQDYARIINQSGLHLLSVVNALLEPTKATAGPAANDTDAIASGSNQRMMQVA